jgi:Ca2+/Na+ antiporter
MTSVQIFAVVAVLLVAAAVFVLIIRADTGRVRRGEAEAEAKGEEFKKSPPLGLIYFGVGVAFVVVGIFTLLGKN